MPLTQQGGDMHRKVVTFALVFAAFMSVGSAFAGISNFKPANMTGDSPAAEEHSRHPHVKSETESNMHRFWSKEAERSGFANIGKGFSAIGAAFANSDTKKS